MKKAARRGEAGLLLQHRGRQGREGVEVQRQVHVVDRLPERLPRRMPHRLHVPGAGELHAAQAELGHAVDLLHRGVDVAVGQAGQADEAVRVVAAEVHQPVVVDVEHLGGRLVVVEPGGRAEDAVDDLGLHAVAVHVLRAQRRSRRTGDALPAVIVETGRRHHVHAVVLAGLVLGPGRPHAAPEAEVRAVPGGPEGAVGRRPSR